MRCHGNNFLSHSGVVVLVLFSSSIENQIRPYLSTIFYCFNYSLAYKTPHEKTVRLQSLALQAAADAIVITDAEGNVDWVNRAFVKLTGYPADDIYGRKLTLLKLDPTPPHVYMVMWEAIASGKVWAGELINKRKDGQCYTEEQSITPVRNREGSITHYIAIKRDITQRKQTEQALRDSEAGLRKLYEITSAPDSNLDRKITQLLELGCNRLGLGLGIVSHIVGQTYEVVAVHAPAMESVRGLHFNFAERTAKKPFRRRSPSDLPGQREQHGSCTHVMKIFTSNPTLERPFMWISSCMVP